MDPALIALISAATAVLGGAVTKTFDSWLGGRAKVVEELRHERLAAYEQVWQRTRTLSAWPRTDAKYEDLRNLHLFLRSWYFAVGGLYLSDNARDRYGEMQELIAAHLDAKSEVLEERLDDDEYKDLMDACHAFRVAATEDLESRRQRSLLWTIGRARLHRAQAREARERLARVARPGKYLVRAPLERPEPTTAQSRIERPGADG